MKQVMNYNKDNGLLNMIRRTDPMIVKMITEPSPWSKCRLSPCYMPSLSLLARVFSPCSYVYPR